MKHNKRGFVLKAVQHLVHETMKLQGEFVSVRCHNDYRQRRNSLPWKFSRNFSPCFVYTRHGNAIFGTHGAPNYRKDKVRKGSWRSRGWERRRRITHLFSGGSQPFKCIDGQDIEEPWLDTLVRIHSRPRDLPSRSIREISRILYEETRVKFPGARYTAIVGFLFLRFICPALINPESYLGGECEPSLILNQLVPRLSHKVRQALISITRVIQTIANRAQEEKKVSPDALALVHKYENRIKEWVDKILVCTAVLRQY